jgi:serine phosphatase RsbU (regulator of sigma subunit)
LLRYGALSKLSSEIASATTERELVERVTSGLEALFGPTSRVGFFRTDPGRNELLTAHDSTSDRGLLSSLHDLLPAAKRGKPALIYIAAPNIFFGADGTMLSAPLIDRTTMLGLLVVERTVEHPDFGIEDLDALTGVAGQARDALSRLRTQRKHMSHDLELAKQIQQGFLQLPPELNGFRIAAQYRPALNVGGDFYDLVPTGNGQVMAVIGDVSGKGVSAALLMSRVSMEFRRIAKESNTPKALLSQLNRSVCELSPDDTFVTAACLKLDAFRRRLTVANAGHVLPVVRRASGSVLTLGAASGLPLGMLPTESYTDQTFDLDVGDIVLLMTDGVVDALEGDALDMRALLDLISVAPHDAAKINDRILMAVERAVETRLGDDVALLSLEVTPESAASATPAKNRSA